MHGGVQLFPGVIPRREEQLLLSPFAGAAAAARRSCGQMGGASSRSQAISLVVPGAIRSSWPRARRRRRSMALLVVWRQRNRQGNICPVSRGMSAKGGELCRPAEPSFAARHVREFSRRIAFSSPSAIGQSMRLERSLAPSLLPLPSFSTPCPALQPES